MGSGISEMCVFFLLTNVISLPALPDECNEDKQLDLTLKPCIVLVDKRFTQLFLKNLISHFCGDTFYEGTYFLGRTNF